MAAGTAYAKRYGGGFADGSGGGTPIDSTFLNAVETALLQLIGSAPTVDGQVAQWDNANTRFGPALILNKNIDPAAAIVKSKLDFTGANGIVNADIAGAAAIAKSKLAALSIVDADVAVGAAIQASKITGLYTGPTTYRKTTAKTVNNTLTETDLLNAEITVAGNVIGLTGALRLSVIMDALNSTGGAVTFRYRLKFGATTVFDSGVVSFAVVTGTRNPIRFDVLGMNLGATNSQLWKADFFAPFANNNTAWTTPASDAAYATSAQITGSGINTSAEDTTTSKALVLTVQMGTASVSAEAKLSSALVEIV